MLWSVSKGWIVDERQQKVARWGMVVAWAAIILGAVMVATGLRVLDWPLGIIVALLGGIPIWFGQMLKEIVQESVYEADMKDVS